jgi:flagellar motility protein MotE (MotC chaperone)
MAGFRLSAKTVLPSMIVVAAMTLTLRVGDLWQTISEGTSYTGVRTVQAAEEKATEPTPPPTEPVKTDAAQKEEPKTEEKTAQTKSEKRSSDDIETGSDLYKQLMGRREQLDKRAKELEGREALILVAEKRLDQKVREMETLKKQIETLLGQAGAQQQEQIDNLVKVYEIMKPKDAAKIFETIDLPILLGVVQKMKPARTAAVLAEMNPEKAKEITVALTRRDQLPELK